MKEHMVTTKRLLLDCVKHENETLTDGSVLSVPVRIPRSPVFWENPGVMGKRLLPRARRPEVGVLARAQLRALESCLVTNLPVAHWKAGIMAPAPRVVGRVNGLRHRRGFAFPLPN